MNVIMRVAYNRPEMLQLSIEYEIAAREHHTLPGKFHTLFVIEHGAPQKIFDLINKYPFEHSVITRDQKFELTKNILEGMKEAFKLTNDYIIYIEDDILVHKSYFKYMDILLNMKDLGPYTVLSAYNKNDGEDVSEVYRGHHYCAWAALITKKFFMDYIIHCINPSYYESYASRDRFVKVLDNKCKKYWEKGYKYRGDGKHHAQAGVINRFVDLAMIQNGAYVIIPYVNRQQHIGYCQSYNRPGGILPGNDFEERLENLKETILNADKMYELSGTKIYNDYKIFSPKLDEWDGTIYVK
jgi:hypothetical protein